MATVGSLIINIGARTDAFHSALAQADRSVTKLHQSMDAQIATFGMSTRQAEIYTAQLKGVDKAVIDVMQAQDKHLTMMEKAAVVIEQTRTPLEREMKQVDELNRLVRAGAIDLETYSRAMNQMGASAVKSSNALTPYIGRLKAIGAAASIFALVRAGAQALGDAMDDLDNSRSFFDRLGEAAEKVPILGDIAKFFARIYVELTGAGEAYRQMNREHAEFMKGMAEFEHRRQQAATILPILQEIEKQVAALGVSSEVAALRAAGATDVAIHKAMEHLALIEAYNTAISNEQGRFALIRALEEEAGLWGQNAREIDLYRASLLGATEADIQHINWLHDKLDAMKALQEAQDALNRLMDEGRRVWEQTRTPLEAYNLELERLRKLLEAGAIDEETFRRAVEQAKEELERHTKTVLDTQMPQIPQRPAVLENPSAREFRFTSGVPGRGLDPMKESNNTLKKIDRSEQFQVGLLRDIRNLLQSPPDAGEVVGF